MPKRPSEIWKFFEKTGTGNKTAFCKYCSKKLSYQSTITNLKYHLEKQHKSEYIMLLKLTKQFEPTTLRNKISEPVQNSKQAFNSNLLWNSFAKSSDGSRTVTCNYCNNTLSYNNTIDNLKAHLKMEHKKEYNELLNLKKLDKFASEKSSDDEETEIKFENEENHNNCPVIFEKEVGNVRKSPTTSDEEEEEEEKTLNDANSDITIWNFFEKSKNDDETATCNDCSNALSYKTSIANLEEHLKEKHVLQYNDYLNTQLPEPLKMQNNITSDTENTGQNETDSHNDVPIWNFYEKSDSRTALCNYCNTTLSYNSSTTNLEEHLKVQHDSEYNNFLDLTKQLVSNPPLEDSVDEIEETDYLCISPVEEEEKKMPLRFSDTGIWNFFECHDITAVCNFCGHELSCEHSITNLKLHLKTKHVTEYKNFLNSATQLEPVTENVCEISERKENKSRYRKVLWNFFEKSKHGRKFATCNYCGRKLSYATTITNLKQHLRKKHASEYEIFSNLSKELATVIFPKNQEEMNQKKVRNPSNARIWEYFKNAKRGDRVAICKYCSNRFSYKTTITNLKCHLKSKHIQQYKELVEEDLPLSIKRRRLQSMSDRSTTSESEIADGYSETDEEAAEEQAQEPEIEDVWNYFEKLPSNRAQCILCKETFNRHLPFLTRHMKEKHRKIAWDQPSDSDEDQNCYTEVVYLEEEQPTNVTTTTKQPQVTKKRRLSSRYELVNKPKDVENISKIDEIDDEIEIFGRYVISLLKKMPKDASTQLQMDIIGMIMKAKLKLGTTEPVSVSVSNVQDGVIVTPGNIIVTTPSNVIHTTQNNESLPTLVIGVENET
ncbi:uncharacterized protein [Maniola hyperantus]|uniref:uncharacterized protein isoform X1 n=1 Tax=Aphantopus hyperantus TaxID=2795564 RepID=UPI0037493DFF